MECEEWPKRVMKFGDVSWNLILEFCYISKILSVQKVYVLYKSSLGKVFKILASLPRKSCLHDNSVRTLHPLSPPVCTRFWHVLPTPEDP